MALIHAHSGFAQFARLLETQTVLPTSDYGPESLSVDFGRSHCNTLYQAVNDSFGSSTDEDRHKRRRRVGGVS